MRRIRGIVPVLCGAISVLAAACRGSTFQIYEFQSPAARLASGGTIEVDAIGRSSQLDSAGMLIDRVGTPYRIEVYITGHHAGELQVSGVRLAGQSSGTTLSPRFSPTTVFDSVRLVSTATEVDLPFEDHIVTIQLNVGAGSRVRHETVEVLLKANYQERHISFLEWLAHI